MDKASVAHESFIHRDAAPGTLTVRKVAFRRQIRRRWQRRVHEGILINPTPDCQRNTNAPLSLIHPSPLAATVSFFLPSPLAGEGQGEGEAE